MTTTHTTAGPTMPEVLRGFVQRHGDTEAVVEAGTRVSYSELDRASSRLARQLLTLGLGKGSRVGILLPNGADWVTTFAAAGRIGAVALPVSTLAQAPELAWLVREADIELLVVAPGFRTHDYLARLEDALPGLAEGGRAPLYVAAAPRLRHVVSFVERPRPAPWLTRLPEPVVDEDFLAQVESSVRPHDPLVVIHTSGSTADPKGVIHSHGAVLGHTATMAEHYVPQGIGDRICSPRPWFWVAGLAADLLYALHCGSTVVVPADGEPETIAGLIESERLDYVGGSPVLFGRLAATPSLAAAGIECLALGIDLAGVAEVDTAGAERFRSGRLEERIPAAEARGFDLARFPNLFGMTEAVGSHSALPHGTQVDPGREGTSGPPVPGMERRVVDPASGRDVEPGEEGELLIRGRSLMVGLDRRDPQGVFDACGWYATGDICRLDADGWITFRSRRGDMVKVSGANVAPLEVERALHRHPDVEEAVVVGLDSPSGALLTAFVVPVAPELFDEDALVAWMRTQLSSYKVPRRFEVMAREEIPRTASGKVRAHELRARFGR